MSEADSSARLEDGKKKGTTKKKKSGVSSTTIAKKKATKKVRKAKKNPTKTTVAQGQGMEATNAGGTVNGTMGQPTVLGGQVPTAEAPTVLGGLDTPGETNQEVLHREVIAGFTQKRCLVEGYGCEHRSMQVMDVLDNKGYFESYRDDGKGFFFNTSCAKCGMASSSMDWFKNKQKKTNRIIYYCQIGCLSSVETENGKFCPWWCIPCGDELKDQESREYDARTSIGAKRSRRLAAAPERNTNYCEA